MCLYSKIKCLWEVSIYVKALQKKNPSGRKMLLFSVENSLEQTDF